MEPFQYYPQRGVVTSLRGNYQAKVNLPEAQFDTTWADSCVWLPAEGVEVLVVFVNGDLNRPVITHRFPTDTEIGTPSIEIAGGGAPLARVGDYIQAATGTYTDPQGNQHTYSGIIISGSSKVTSG